MASASAPRRSPRARHPLPLQQPADSATASTSAPRRSARARRPPPRPADSGMASTSPRRRTTRARRPLPQAADRAVASTSARARRRSARGPVAQTFLPDEIWEDIFLRLDAAADLARASAACSSFRRIVSEHRFLRRFHSLHSPAILGFITPYGYQRFFPVRPPHRSSPEARALQQAADFTFSFIPDRYSWHSCHARDGRVLLSRPISLKTQLQDFMVCDPLHRRYVKIPRIPDDLLAASTPDARPLLPVLAPAEENDEEESFRIICTVQHKVKGKVMAFVFSSCNQMWQGIISTIHLPDESIRWEFYYAHGCLYWIFGDKGYYSLMLDTSEMKFSIIELPPHNFDSILVIVEAADGRLGFLAICDGTVDLYSKNWQSNGVGAQEWHHDKLIPLPKDSGINYSWHILGTAGCYIALLAHNLIRDKSSRNYEYFVLDIKTLLVEKLCTLNSGPIYGVPYARFPPPLVLPSI